MLRFILRRVLLMIPILLGVIFIVFAIMSLTPGNPASMILGITAEQDAIDQLNHELGFDQPFFRRFYDYMSKLLFRFDMGKSYYAPVSVASEVLSKLPVTLLVAALGMSFAVLVGIPLGVLSAVRQYSLWDSIPTAIALFFASVPTFWLGMVIMFAFSQQLGWLPSNGIGTWQHFVLPTLALGLPYAATEMRFTRSSMLETIRQDYIRTAKAKGAKRQMVIWKHALKNALLPVITVTGINFGALIGGAVITESLFSIPGIGTLIITSIRQKNIPMVTGATIVLAVCFSIVMLVVDMLYALVDPRIRASYERRKIKESV